LSCDQEILYNFLAGVIDGDGTVSRGRIGIYISKEWLAQSVIISCLRLGIMPQVTNNRNIYNIQLVEKIDKITAYTKRVKINLERISQDTRFFNTKQLFTQKNYGSNINNRRDKNLLIGEKELRKINNVQIKKLVNSSLRHLRIRDTKN